MSLKKTQLNSLLIWPQMLRTKCLENPGLSIENLDQKVVFPLDNGRKKAAKDI